MFKKGFTGRSRYTGPGNPLENGEPINKDDAVSKVHDYGYQAYQDSGQNPYVNYNTADEHGERSWSNTTPEGAVAKQTFALKRHAYEQGLIDRLDDSGVSFDATNRVAAQHIIGNETSSE